MLQSINQRRCKFWVVLCGRQPGVYEDAQLAQMQVHGYPGGQIAKFNSIEQAQEYLFFDYNKVRVQASFDNCTVSYIVQFADDDPRNTKGIEDCASAERARMYPFEKTMQRLSASPAKSKFMILPEDHDTLTKLENLLNTTQLPTAESALRKSSCISMSVQLNRSRFSLVVRLSTPRN